LFIGCLRSGEIAMEQGRIPVDKQFDLEFRYHEKDAAFKYFNRKFEVALVKKGVRKMAVFQVDNSDAKSMMPAYYVATESGRVKKLNVGLSSLNWNEIKNNLVESVVTQFDGIDRENLKKAVGKLHSPKL